MRNAREKPPSYMKYYTKSSRRQEAAADRRLKPSAIMAELTTGRAPPAQPAAPRIIGFTNMEDHTAALKTSVAMTVPLFQPAPSVVCFQSYEAFGVHEQLLYFRNNDSVARRIQVLQPDSAFFEVSGAMTSVGSALKQSKVAAGMEVCFRVVFKPEEVREYRVELVCCTERERFVVPVVAYGLRPVLSFPDEIIFSTTPVKHASAKSFTVRNVGTAPADFRLACSNAAFTATPANGRLEVGATAMIEVGFAPLRSVDYEGELLVDYGGGEVAEVSLYGVAENVDVRLSSSAAVVEPAYIGLSSRRTVKIVNDSDVPVRFCWRALCSPEEDHAQREKRTATLRGEQADEERALDVSPGPETASSDTDGDDDLSGDDDGAAPSEAGLALAALSRKYRHLRRAIAEDEMLFSDAVFEITPLQGEVWAHSEVEVTVTCRPDVAAEFAASAFLDVVGLEDRLELSLAGRGIGPKIALTFDALDIGEVFINSQHRYQLQVSNRGDIPAAWRIEAPPSSSASRFSFGPAQGLLETGEHTDVDVQFCSAGQLGEFHDAFDFCVNGSDEVRSCKFKGSVIGPTFHFDAERIDFGVVPFAFETVRSATLTNTSDVQMVYHLRVPQDGTFVKEEFAVAPADGRLNPGASQQVRITLLSTTVKAYEYTLSVDVDGVGEGVLSLPVAAECRVPSVSLAEPCVAYGECFLRYPYEGTLVLQNDDANLGARYAIAPQDPSSAGIAIFETLSPEGTIPAGGRVEVAVRLTCQRLGAFRIPIIASIAGSVEPPLRATLEATGVGPRVLLGCDALRWGNTRCLVDKAARLKLTNDSLIPAPFTASIKSGRSKFRVDVREGVLGPGEDVELQVIANLDDTIAHRDELLIAVKNGESLAVPLSARGTGTTMHCGEGLETVDFGSQFTSHPFERRVTLENRGRRTQALRWINQTAREVEAARQKRLKALQKEGKAPPSAGGEGASPVFSVVPEEAELRPRTAMTFTFHGLSARCGAISEQLVCESKVGKEKGAKAVFRTQVRAAFIDPLLQASAPGFDFAYTYEQGVPMRAQAKTLTLTNATALPLDFVLRAQAPFSVSRGDHSLQPGEAATVDVAFDAGYRGDRQSHRVESALGIAYRDHPQRDQIPLAAMISFPNLDFALSTVDFGCVLNDTTKTMVVRVTNTSAVEVRFAWSFLEDGEPGTRGGARRPQIPVNEVFDILPIRSTLAAGASEDIEFVYFGHANRRFRGTALAEVEGGPRYELTLVGEASTVGYRLDRPLLDFGGIPFFEAAEREFSIVNTGRVPFPFQIALQGGAGDGGDGQAARRRAGGLVEVLPSTGTVPANDKQRVLVRFRPGLPETIVERLVIEVAHFDPVEFPIYGRGTFAAVVVSLPRDARFSPWGRPLPSLQRSAKGRGDGVAGESEMTWDEVLEAAQGLLASPDPALAPPEGALLPPAPEDSTARCATAQLLLAASASLPSAPSAEGASLSTGECESSARSALPERAARRATAPGSAGEGSAPALPLDVEMEANRLVYVQHLRELWGGAAAAPPGPASAAPPSPRLPERPPSAATGVEAASRGADFVLARYLLDFGNVVQGSSRRRSFRVTNSSRAGPLSWNFDKKALAGTGFSVDPMNVVRLPENGSVTFNVTFATKKAGPLGATNVVLPIRQKSGAPVHVSLLANVTVPRLSITAETLDFGEVRVGCSRVLHLQLHNTSLVAAEWDFRAPSGGARDSPCFRTSPSGGSVPPGGRCNVAIEFVPAEQREYAVRLPLKIATVARARGVTFSGTGLQAAVAFDPPLLELGPVRPGDSTAQSACRLVGIVNSSERDVEVYSLDLDRQYREEESILAAAAGYGADDVMRLPLRRPGDGLPAHILDEHRRAQRLAAREPEGSDEGLRAPVPSWDREPTARDEGEAADVVLFGPPLSGKTRMARRVGARFGYAVTTIDELLQELSGEDSALGAEVRAACDRRTPAEQRAHDSALRAAEEEVAAESATRKKGKGKGGARDASSDAANRLRDLRDASQLRAALVERLLRRRGAMVDAGRGLVLDGLGCRAAKNADVQEIARGAARALPRATLAVLSFSEDAYAGRLRRLREAEAQQLEIPPGAEEAATSAAGGSEGAGSDAASAAAAAAELEPLQDGAPVSARLGLGHGVKGVTHGNNGDAGASGFSDFCAALDGVVAAFRAGDGSSVQAGEAVPAGAPEQAGDAEADGDGEAHSEDNATGGSGQGGDEPVARTVILDAAAEDDEATTAAALFGELPPPLTSAPGAGTLRLPAARDYQLCRRPAARVPRPAVSHFELLPYVEGLSAEEISRIAAGLPATAAESATEDAAGKGAKGKGAKGGKHAKAGKAGKAGKAARTDEPEPAPPALPPMPTRWVVPAGGRANFWVKFRSDAVGRVDQTLGFEVCGGSGREYSLPLVGLCAVPSINTDPRNVFMSRQKSAPGRAGRRRSDASAPVSKRFITSRNCYDFGPLLRWKEAALALAPADADVGQGEGSEGAVAAHAAARETNAETLRLTNNGPFPATLSLAFEGGEDSAFHVQPQSLELPAGETSQATVWCFPGADSACDDTLVCSIEGNPDAAEFRFTALGATPSVRLTGPWQPAEQAPGQGGTDAAPASAPADTETAGVGRGDGSAVLDFGRQLLARSSEQSFAIENTSAVPVAWELDASALSALGEFRVSPSSGVLPVGGSATVCVGFRAAAERAFDETITLVYSDVEGGLGTTHRGSQAGAPAPSGAATAEDLPIVGGDERRVFRQPVKVLAEAYSIRAVAFDAAEAHDGAQPADAPSSGNDGAVDFGLVRVGDRVQRTFPMRNLGKYPIAFRLSFRRPRLGSVLEVSPLEGEIAAGGSVDVRLSLCTLQELRLRENRDLRCAISEPATGEAVEEFAVSVSAEAQWSAFHLQPGRGINFGALQFNAEPRTRTIELKNTSSFEFAFAVEGPAPSAAARAALVASTPLALLGDDDRTAAEEHWGGAQAAAQAGQGAPAIAAPPSDAVSLGQFTVSPGGGTLQPGEVKALALTFRPGGLQLHREKVALRVSGARPDAPATLAALGFEAVGESCYPALVTSEWRGIFEEQAVVGALAELRETERARAAATGTSACFAEQDRVFSFGAIVCGAPQNPRGMCERVKLMNPTKVTARVKLRLLAAAQAGASGEEDLGAFSVTPESVEVAPHDYAFASVYFNPREMRCYRAAFEAVVQDAKDEASGTLAFGLAGRGLLPCVTVERPARRDAEGGVDLDFGRVQVGKSRRLRVSLRNDGPIPATCLFLWAGARDAPRAFAFEGAGGSATLAPGERHEAVAEYAPQALSAADDACVLELSVMHNKFERQRIALRGEAFTSDASLEDLPEAESGDAGGAGETIDFGELDLRPAPADGAAPVEQRTVRFTLRSNARVPLRFTFAAHGSFFFAPAAGHLQPAQAKEVEATFRCESGGDADFTGERAAAIKLTLQRIRYERAGADVDWDDAMVEAVPSAEGGAAGEAMVRRTPDEPQWAPEGGSGAGAAGEERVLRCVGRAGVAGYECDAAELPFRDTFMFQTRTARVNVRNTGSTRLPYSFEAAGALPFSVQPRAGSIAGKGSQDFEVRFSPREAGHFNVQLHANLRLPEGLPPLALRCRGRALRPLCHFDLPDASEYLARRDGALLNELGQRGRIASSSVRVVCVESRGTGVRNARPFGVLNPTGGAYDFQWEPVGDPSPAWRCLTPKGALLSGRRGEMRFEFTPEVVGTAEAFYRFRIPKHRVDELFLLVGTVAEPLVRLDRPRLYFSKLMLGAVATEEVHLVNEEDTAFRFAFDRASLGAAPAAARRPVLQLHPMSGVVPPKGRARVQVRFSPPEERDYNFNLRCSVRRKPTPLGLNVKGEGYAVRAQVRVEGRGPLEPPLELLPAPQVNVLDFGRVNLDEEARRELSVFNSGKFNFDYAVRTGGAFSEHLQLRSGSAHGAVRQGDRAALQLCFAPTAPCDLGASELRLEVAGKYEYVLRLRGTGARPALAFSFREHDFGAVFVAPPGLRTSPAVATLRVTNADPSQRLSLDCEAPAERSLRVACPSAVLAPSEHVDVQLSFAPRELRRYDIVVPFLVNGRTRVPVRVTGAGVAAKLDLVDAAAGGAAFGAVQEGTVARRSVRVVNRSPCALTFSLEDDAGELAACGVTFAPCAPVTLAPRAAAAVEVTFAPAQRMPGFQGAIHAVLPTGERRKLLAVSGQALGHDVALLSDAIAFGTVTAGSRKALKLVLDNRGDAPVTFRWEQDTFGPHFRVAPLAGRAPPGAELAFDVTFAPASSGADLRAERMTLALDGAPPLFVACSGRCVEQPPGAVETLAFSCAARGSEVRRVALRNPSDKPWFLTPVLAGGAWTCGGELAVPPRGEAQLELRYAPQSMTRAEAAAGEGVDKAAALAAERPERHEGSLFFALPDGSAKAFALVGTAGPPALAGTHEVVTPAKQAALVRLPVRNWLSTPQVFRVTRHLAACDDLAATFLAGADLLEVPAGASRDYAMRLTAFKEGAARVVVTFTGDDGEFASHEVLARATAPGASGLLKVEAPLRQVGTAILTVDNPLPPDAPVDFPEDWWSCSSTSVRLRRLGEMRGAGEGAFEVEYRPLRPTPPGGEAAELRVTCEQLGTYVYDLRLVALPAPRAPPVVFDASLGGTGSAAAALQLFNAAPITLRCAVEAKPGVFRVAPAVAVDACDGWEGQRVVVPIDFEPEAPGELGDLLRVDAGDFGTYEVALRGSCRPPLPAGPFPVPAGGSVDVPFRNVFSEAHDFAFAIDSAGFSIGERTASVAAKTARPIKVSFSPEQAAGERTARLVVSCLGLPDLPPWVFYIKGGD